ncbi:hypothetical protein [Limosilactobacillus frumenti]|uniref:hypothetical protein n=1 Tax=Limosilactobacillus frumenti TaxID=104955 RepID=UPI0015EC592F|nr:hypothetical protein [Limosilactobacillus frumenti]MBA2913788.1 hypothetical protein [Limosilactobacillus frumenti]
MNQTFMAGYYQSVVEVAPASLSAAQVERLAVTMTIQHLRHAGVSITSIHDFLVDTIHADDRVVKQYLNLSAAQLESAQAELLALAFKNEEA